MRRLRPRRLPGTALPSAERRRDADQRRILRELREWDNQGTGQLFKKSCGDGAADRRTFERLLSGLVRAELVRTRSDSFQKDGKVIRFQRAALTRAAYSDGEELLATVTLTEEPKTVRKKWAARKRKTASKRPSRKATVRAKKTGVAGRKTAGAPSPIAQSLLFDALKAWRLGEARRRRIPAFRIMPNRSLEAIAEARPLDEEELLAVHGMGPTLVRKYGAKLLGIVSSGG